MYERSSLFGLFPAFGIITILKIIFSVLVDAYWCIIVVLIYIFLTDNSVEKTYLKFICQSYFLSGEISVHVLCQFSFHFFGHVACGVLVPWPGIEPMHPAVAAWSPSAIVWLDSF